MNIEINNGGDIVIDTSYLLSMLTSTQSSLAVQALSCREDVIRCVMDQVLDGYTEDGYYGAHSSFSEKPSYAIAASRRRIVENSNQVVTEEIESFKKLITSLREELKETDMKLRRYTHPHEFFNYDRGEL